jgi:hypothetical protein
MIEVNRFAIRLFDPRKNQIANRQVTRTFLQPINENVRVEGNPMMAKEKSPERL